MSTAYTAPDAQVERRIAAVARPRPVLDRGRCARLTTRQRELLDEVSALFAGGGFAQLTMADLASELNCSLRTLYSLAPSREELVLVAIDRHLWETGRRARRAVRRAGGPGALDALRAYLGAAHVAVVDTTEAFVRDMALVPGASALAAAHSGYLVAVTAGLLDLAVERGEVAPIDTRALAQVIAGVGATLAAAEVMPTLRSSPRHAADEVVEVVLAGLRSLPGGSRRQRGGGRVAHSEASAPWAAGPATGASVPPSRSTYGPLSSSLSSSLSNSLSNSQGVPCAPT